MNFRTVLSVTGGVLFVVAVFLLGPLGVAWLDDEPRAMLAYGGSAALTLLLAVGLRLGGGPPSERLHRKDAIGIVAFTWLWLGLIGALPLMLDGAITDFPSAFFEAVSGFTTTGATVVADVDALSRATNLWRCLMHWLGGMGIVVLFVAVFPLVGVGAKQLFKTEVPGLPGEGLTPRIRETALRLWWVYTGLTLACTGLLVLEGMDAYDAICHAFSALGTGGFSTRTASVGAWDNPAIHWTLTFFMIAAGLNFALYAGVLMGRWRALFVDAELRFYLAVNLLIMLVVFLLLGPSQGFDEATIREAAFQVASVTTTTGFMTADFDTYPDLARLLLVLAMVMGGCAGSTAGGLKAVRVLLLGALSRRAVEETVQPHGVSAVRLGGAFVPDAVLSGVLVFGATYLGIWAAASVALAAMGLDLVTAVSAAIACLSSIGPGLAAVGPTQNYAIVPGAGKVLLGLCMLAGRLEVFALLAVFTPEVWRR